MTGRPRSVSDREVFDAVTAVVSDAGPSGLTLAAIARRVGLTAPALTQRFGSKHGLLVAYAEHSAGGVDELFDDALATSPDPLAALRSALVSFAAPVADRTALANSLAFLHLDLTDPDLGAFAARQSRLLRRRMAELLTGAADRGLLRGADPVVLAELLYTLYNGALITWAIDGTGALGDWIDQRLEQACRPYLASQLPVDPRRRRSGS